MTSSHFRKLTDQQLAEVERWMKTRAYRKRAERARKRHQQGELLNFERARQGT
jgi:hypothetical protein